MAEVKGGYVPSSSQAQQHLMMMALAHKRGTPLKAFDVGVKTRQSIAEIASSMSEAQLTDFKKLTPGAPKHLLVRGG